LAGPGHICLQDNKLSPTLHAHTFAPSTHGNRGADLSITFVDRSITKAAHTSVSRRISRGSLGAFCAIFPQTAAWKIP
jgi:hypothetical protein